MRTLLVSFIGLTLFLGACSTGAFVSTSGEYDDLYYSPSSESSKVISLQEIEANERKINNQQDLKSAENIDDFYNYAENILENDSLNSIDTMIYYNDEPRVYVNNFQTDMDYDYAMRLKRFYGNSMPLDLRARVESDAWFYSSDPLYWNVYISDDFAYYAPTWINPYYSSWRYGYSGNYWGISYSPFNWGLSFSWGFPYYYSHHHHYCDYWYPYTYRHYDRYHGHRSYGHRRSVAYSSGVGNHRTGIGSINRGALSSNSNRRVSSSTSSNSVRRVSSSTSSSSVRRSSNAVSSNSARRSSVGTNSSSAISSTRRSSTSVARSSSGSSTGYRNGAYTTTRVRTNYSNNGKPTYRSSSSSTNSRRSYSSSSSNQTRSSYTPSYKRPNTTSSTSTYRRSSTSSSKYSGNSNNGSSSSRTYRAPSKSSTGSSYRSSGSRTSSGSSYSSSGNRNSSGSSYRSSGNRSSSGSSYRSSSSSRSSSGTSRSSSGSSSSRRR